MHSSCENPLSSTDLCLAEGFTNVQKLVAFELSLEFLHITQLEDHSFGCQKTRRPSTKKVGCPAAISISKIATFPKFKVGVVYLPKDKFWFIYFWFPLYDLAVKPDNPLTL